MTGKRIILLLLGIAVLISACGPKGSDRDGLVDLTGRVTETDTTVYLSDVFVYQEGTGGLTDTSDENGYFELDGIPFTPSSIFFEKEGYQKLELKFEYVGELKKPLVTKWIMMKKVGEDDSVVVDSM